MFGLTARSWIGLALVVVALVATGCVGAHHSNRPSPMNEVDGVLQGPS